MREILPGPERVQNTKIQDTNTKMAQSLTEPLRLLPGTAISAVVRICTSSASLDTFWKNKMG